MSKALEVKNKWSEKFDTGLIQIIEQRFKGNMFFNGKSSFTSSNGIRLESSCSPEIAEKHFYVRGYNHERDNEILLVSDCGLYLSCLEAVKEYNEAVNKPDINYLALHYKLWMKLACTGEQHKSSYATEIAEEAGIPPPRGGCFLCEEVVSNTPDGGVADCIRCKGYWGVGCMKCTDYGAYYKMWEREEDVDLRMALARRIANSVYSSESTNLK